MSIGFWQIAIVVVLVVLLFGRGKISSLMGDVAKGIKSFKKGMSDSPDQSSSSLISKPSFMMPDSGAIISTTKPSPAIVSDIFPAPSIA